MKILLILILLIASCKKGEIRNNSSEFTNTSAVSIGVVDMQKVETSSVAVQKMQKCMIQKEKSVIMELGKRKMAIESKYTDLQKKRGTLSEEAMQAQISKLEESFRDLQEDERKYSAILEATKNSLGRIFSEKVAKVVADLSSKKDLTVVMPSAVFLYYNDKDSSITDLTLEVVANINPEFKEKDLNCNAIFEENLNQIKRSSKK